MEASNLPLDYLIKSVRNTGNTSLYKKCAREEALWVGLHVVFLTIQAFYVHDGLHRAAKPKEPYVWPFSIFFAPQGKNAVFPFLTVTIFVVLVVISVYHICCFVSVIAKERWYCAFEPCRCGAPALTFKTDAEPAVKASMGFFKLILEYVKVLGPVTLLIMVFIFVPRWIISIFLNFVKEILSLRPWMRQNPESLLSERMVNFRMCWTAGTFVWFFLNQSKILRLRPVWFMYFGVLYVICDVYYVYELREFRIEHGCTALYVVATTLLATWFHETVLEIDPVAIVEKMHSGNTRDYIKGKVENYTTGDNPRFPFFSNFYRCIMIFVHIDLLILLTCIFVVYHDLIAYAFVAR
jgi:hypothetical protein